MRTYIFFCLITCVIILQADQAHNLHRYMWANFHQAGGNLKTAHEWYKQISDVKGSVYTHKGYIHLLEKADQYPLIIQLITKKDTFSQKTLDEIFSNDPDIQLIFASALKKTGKTQEADSRLIKLSRQFKNNPEITFQAAETFVRIKEPENALATIDDFLNSAIKRPNNFVFHYLKAQIYSQLNKYDLALQAVQESVKTHPHFAQGWLMLAVLQEKTGKLEDAIKGYSTFLEVNAHPNKQIEQHLLQLMLKQKSLEQNKNVVLINQTCFEKAVILFQRKQFEQALNQIDQCLKEHPTDTQGRLLKIQILTELKQFDETLILLMHWIEQEPYNEIWLKTIHVLPRAGIAIEKVVEALETLHKKLPQQLLPLLYLADLSIRVEQHTQALSYLQKAYELTNNNELKTKLLFQQGIIYFEQGNFGRMRTVLEQGIQLETDFPPLLNLLAYFYATKGKQLPKAYNLIEKALTHDPKNPHFLDTKAVILYKQKEYGHAHTILKQLVEQVNNDPMIQIHLAKTWYKLGNIEQAKKIVETAQKIAHNNHAAKTVHKFMLHLNNRQ